MLINWSYGFLPMLFKLEWYTTFEHGVKSLLNVFWRPFLDPLITHICVSDYQSNQGRATYLRRLGISKIHPNSQRQIVSFRPGNMAIFPTQIAEKCSLKLEHKTYSTRFYSSSLKIEVMIVVAQLMLTVKDVVSQ